jgi:hypothetical protein
MLYCFIMCRIKIKFSYLILILDDWPFIYFVIFVSMDEKIECRSLYFLVSILRGIIFIVSDNYTYTYHIGV